MRITYTYYRLFLLHIIFILPGLFVGNLNAQNVLISSIEPVNLSVCETDSFYVILTNVSVPNVNINGASLGVSFPSNVLYVIGSVEGATETNLNNLSAPSFTLPTLLPFQPDTILVQASANCDIIPTIDAGGIFENTVSVTYSGGSDTYTSPVYDIETSLLIISDVSPTNQSLNFGNTGSRSITIDNTRVGSLNSFEFVDEHSLGLGSLSSSVGTVIVNNTSEFRVRLDGSDFVSIGDGDSLFDLGETIVLTEFFQIEGCDDISSDLSVEWGCGGEICQMDQTSDNIFVTPPTDSPWIIGGGFSNLANCYCGIAPVRQSVQLFNFGDAPASDFQLIIANAANIAGIDPNSIELIDGGVSSPLIPDSLVNITSPRLNTCLSNSNLKQEVWVSIPDINPSASYTVEWDMYYCTEVGGMGTNIYSGFSYRYEYKNLCDHLNSVSFITADVSLFDHYITGPNSILGGTTEGFAHNVFMPDLTNDSGFLSVDYILPPALGWSYDSTDFVANGNQAPLSLVYDTSTNIITAVYELPLSTGNTTINFSLTTNCAEVPSDGRVDTTIVVVPSVVFGENCPVGCGAYTYNWISPISVICEPPGEELFHSLKRTNFGQPDNDFDGYPDVGGSLDFSIVRDDRGIEGDTLLERIRVGFTDSVSHVYDTLEIKSVWTTNVGNWSILHTGISLIDGEIFYYSGADSSITFCGSLAVDTTILNWEDSIQYIFILNPTMFSSGCGLADSVLEEGDSLFIDVRYKIIENVSLIYGIEKLSVSAFVNISDTSGTNHAYLSLNPSEMDITSYRLWNAVYSEELEDCGGLRLKYEFGFRLEGGSDFFPQEYRNFGYWNEISIPRITGFDIVPDSTRMIASRFQLFNPFTVGGMVGNVLLPPASLSGFTSVYDVGTSMLANSSFLTDETSWVYLEVLYENQGCCQPPMINNSPIGRFRTDSFTDSIYAVARYHTYSFTGLGLFADSPAPLIRPQRADVEWVVTLSADSTGNIPEAENVWVALRSASGNVYDLSLIDTLTQTAIPSIGNGFQLGDFTLNESRTYKVIGKHQSCRLDTLWFEYGRNCDHCLYDGSPNSQCNLEEIPLILHPRQSVIDMNLNSPLGPFPLCDTIIGYSLSGFNAERGTAYDVTIRGELPPGVTFVEGSSQFSFPKGSAFIPISDPVQVGGNTYEWNISALDDSIGTNGLLGVFDAPNNEFSLEFALLADCGIVAGASPLFRISHKQICGTDGNTVAEVANPIDIVGVAAPYTTAISVGIDADSVLSCVDTSVVSISVTNVSPTITGLTDSIFVTLPEGIQYVNGSFNGGTNAPTGNVSISSLGSRERLEWLIPQGIGLGGVISFTFKTSGYKEIECGQYSFLTQTVASSSAFCEATNSICDILVQTGDSLINLSIDRPSFELAGFNSSISNGTIAYQTSIRNSGNVAADSLIVAYYVDSDLDGHLTGSDSYLGLDSVYASIASGDVYSYSGILITADSFPSPDFFVVIDETESCACSVDTVLYRGEPFLVELIDFQVFINNANLIELNWTTVFEEGNSHFEIERSLDGTIFERVGELPSKGNSQNNQMYVFYDDTLVEGITYYRIKIVDIDGSFEYSVIREVYYSSDLLSFAIHPNPGADIVKVRYSSEESGVRIRVHDSRGRVIRVFNQEDGSAELNIDMREYPNGMYFVSFVSDIQVISYKKWVKID